MSHNDGVDTVTVLAMLAPLQDSLRRGGGGAGAGRDTEVKYYTAYPRLPEETTLATVTQSSEETRTEILLATSTQAPVEEKVSVKEIQVENVPVEEKEMDLGPYTMEEEANVGEVSSLEEDTMAYTMEGVAKEAKEVTKVAKEVTKVAKEVTKEAKEVTKVAKEVAKVAKEVAKEVGVDEVSSLEDLFPDLHDLGDLREPAADTGPDTEEAAQQQQLEQGHTRDEVSEEKVGGRAEVKLNIAANIAGARTGQDGVEDSTTTANTDSDDPTPPPPREPVYYDYYGDPEEYYYNYVTGEGRGDHYYYYAGDTRVETPEIPHPPADGAGGEASEEEIDDIHEEDASDAAATPSPSTAQQQEQYHEVSSDAEPARHETPLTVETELAIAKTDHNEYEEAADEEINAIDDHEAALDEDNTGGDVLVLVRTRDKLEMETSTQVPVSDDDKDRDEADMGPSSATIATPGDTEDRANLDADGRDDIEPADHGSQDDHSAESGSEDDHRMVTAALAPDQMPPLLQLMEHKQEHPQTLRLRISPSVHFPDSKVISLKGQTSRLAAIRVSHLRHTNQPVNAGYQGRSSYQATVTVTHSKLSLRKNF